MSYMLSIVLCLAVFIMLLWHIWSISKGETSVEAQDHEIYRKIAKERGEVSVFTLYFRVLLPSNLFRLL